MEEVAGCLKCRFLYGEITINNWLEKNGDLEIVDIKPLSSEEDDGALIIFRKE